MFGWWGGGVFGCLGGAVFFAALVGRGLVVALVLVLEGDLIG